MFKYTLSKLKSEFKKSFTGILLVCNILIPLAIGAYIYICMDTNSYFGDFVRSIFAIPIFESSSTIGKIARNWGCDFLFAYALLFTLYGYTKDLSVSIRYAAICSTGLELLQMIQVDFLRCGTFDVVDIAIAMIAICFGAALLSCFNHISFNHIKRKERKK